jgi:lysyl-tRNA synthetase class 2
MTSPVSPWWARDVHADRHLFLEGRGRIRDGIRHYFSAEGFTEVECGALQRSPGNEAHLHAFATNRVRPDGTTEPLYLHTSPEFAAKKLLAAGERRIYALGPVFRNREQGALHAPEFTMLEWYRAGETYDAVVEDCARLVRLAAEAGGQSRFRFRGREADPNTAPERITVAAAFRRFAGIDLLATLSSGGGGNRDAVADAARDAGIKIADDDTWSDIFSRVLVEKVEPMLGVGYPTILEAYPRCEAALARAKDSDPRLADRFELYLCGVEIANGFAELTDPVEQRARFETEMTEKARVYGERYPLDEDFLAALTAMPQAAGVALGFDRLVMLATGAERINQVIWTPLV